MHFSCIEEYWFCQAYLLVWLFLYYSIVQPRDTILSGNTFGARWSKNGDEMTKEEHLWCALDGAVEVGW